MFYSYKKQCQLNKVSLAVEGRTHTKPNKKNNRYCPLFLEFEANTKSTLFPTSFPHKKLTLDGIHGFQTMPSSKRKGHPDSKTKNIDLTEETPFLEAFQTNLSFASLFMYLPCNLEKNVSTLSSSQLLKCPEKHGF